MLSSNLTALRSLDYRLLTVIILTLLAPTLYTTFRIYLISDIPSEWGFNVASQIAWLDIIYEILQEGIVLPLFFVFGAVAGHLKLYHRKVIQCILFVVPIYALISLGIWFFSQNILIFLSQEPGLIDRTVQYIRWETIAIPFRVISDIALIALITLSVVRRLYLFVALQLLVRMAFDFLFISASALNLGIIGVAYSSVAIYATTSAIGLAILFYRPRPDTEQKANVSPIDVDWREWLRISSLSGLESGIRNVAFIVMILKLVNEIGEQGTLWVSNNFIWGWLLLPVLALGNLIKRDTGTHRGFIGERFKGYFILTFIIVLIWMATIPVWGLFIEQVMGIDGYESIVSLTLVLLGFYIVFAFNNVFDSYFYGMGRTDLMLYQSVIVNGIYYGAAFYLYQAGVFVPTLQSIALLFGFGILFDFLVTVILFYLVKYPRKESSPRRTL